MEFSEPQVNKMSCKMLSHLLLNVIFAVLYNDLFHICKLSSIVKWFGDLTEVLSYSRDIIFYPSGTA